MISLFLRIVFTKYFFELVFGRVIQVELLVFDL